MGSVRRTKMSVSRFTKVLPRLLRAYKSESGTVRIKRSKDIMAPFLRSFRHRMAQDPKEAAETEAETEAVEFELMKCSFVRQLQNYNLRAVTPILEDVFEYELRLNGEVVRITEANLAAGYKERRSRVQ